MLTDIVDIKPANMEELTEVITAAEFHPTACHLFVYSSSKGTIRLCDMRSQAICDKHSKRESATLFSFFCHTFCLYTLMHITVSFLHTGSFSQQFFVLSGFRSWSRVRCTYRSYFMCAAVADIYQVLDSGL